LAEGLNLKVLILAQELKMGNRLDVTIVKPVFDGTETISSDYNSDKFDISKAEAFAVTLKYDNGSSVSMALTLQVSTDGVEFFDFPNATQNVTDSSGNHLWDISGTSASFARIKVGVTAGSIDLRNIMFHGKRRH